MVVEEENTDKTLMINLKRLNQANWAKVNSYIKDLLQVQQAEECVMADIQVLKCKRGDYRRKGYYCDFCGRSESAAEIMIVASTRAKICNSCARFCNEVLDNQIY